MTLEWKYLYGWSFNPLHQATRLVTLLYTCNFEFLLFSFNCIASYHETVHKQRIAVVQFFGANGLWKSFHNLSFCALQFRRCPIKQDSLYDFFDLISFLYSHQIVFLVTLNQCTNKELQLSSPKCFIRLTEFDKKLFIMKPIVRGSQKLHFK